MAAKKRRSLISGTPRSVARAGELPPDDATDDRSLSEGSEGTTSEGAIGTLTSLTDKTDRFPEMARPDRPEHTTEETAPRIAGVDASSEPSAAAEEDADWFVRTGQPTDRRADHAGGGSASLEGALVRTAGVGQWVFAFVVAVAIAVFVAVIVWVVASV